MDRTTAVVDAVENVGEQAASVAAAHVAGAVDAIEAAEDAQERAEELAEELAAAAMESERARRIDTLEQECGRWRGEHDTQLQNLRTELQQTRERLDSMTTELAAAITRLPVIQVSSTPPNIAPGITEAVPPVTTIAVVDPAAAAPISASAEPVAAKRTRRWI